jgi:uncharacterized damage-inducible protein DinB
LETAAPGAFGSIRETLEHLVHADGFYLRLLTNDLPEPPFGWEDKPNLGILHTYAVLIGTRLEAAALSVPPDVVLHRKRREGPNESFRALGIYIQIINHGVEHRTNITTILNQAGLATPDLDGWGYMFANQAQFDFTSE